MVHVGAGREQSARWMVLMAAVLLGVWVFLVNSWVCDDAYITFRVSDNLIHGYGLRWNVAERVQTYTNPLWMLVMAGVAALTGEFYYSVFAVSLACLVALLALSWRQMDDMWKFAVLAAVLISSKAFVDYTSSGLEYPLSYLLVGVFYFLVTTKASQNDDLRTLKAGVFVASLAFLNRADALLLYLPALLWLTIRTVRRWRAPGLLHLTLAATPAWAWLLFAVVYYGFPLPNTYYAKVAIGIPRSIQVEQGVAYLLNSVRFDPLTLATVALAVLAWNVFTGISRALSLGALAYVAYAVWVGGDFMSGRFFSLPFLMAALLLASNLPGRRWALALGAGLAALTLVNPLAPVKTGAFYEMGWPWRHQNGIKDERGGYHNGTNLLLYAPFRRLPDFVWVREGRSLAASDETVFVRPSVGFLGYYAGPTKYVIDANALGDPLLARLPVGEEIYFEFWASHYFRPIPDGYVESRRTGSNLITDPLVHDYFDRLSNVTSGPIWSWARARDIVELNVGRYRQFHDMVSKSRPIQVVVRAGNPRFSTDVGDVDASQSVRTTGRAGYLIIGPSVPLRAGLYSVQWQGQAESISPGDLGFVEVCVSRCSKVLSRSSMRAGTSETIAELPFRLKEQVSDIEFRMYVSERARILVQRVALTEQRGQ